LRVFGSLAYTHILGEKRKKLDLKSLKCTFLGYGEPNGFKGYRLYDPQSRRLFFGRDVIFFEDDILSNGSLAIDSNLSPSINGRILYYP